MTLSPNAGADAWTIKCKTQTSACAPLSSTVRPLCMHRIYIDTNDVTQDGWCHLARHDGRLVNDVASELGLTEGMAVVLDYKDPGEEFEFDGTVHFREGEWIPKANR